MSSIIYKPLLWGFILYSVLIVVKCQSTDDPYFTTGDPYYCGGALTGVWGEFTSPNYPSNYYDNMDCIWVITVPAIYQIELHFASGFRTESPPDFVEIRDGPYWNSPLLRHLTGSIANPVYLYSSSNTMWVWFHSDHSVTYRGFSAIFYAGGTTEPPTEQTTEHATEPTTEPAPEPTTEDYTTEIPGPYCSEDLYDDFGYFSSPYYPSTYPNNANCIWRINVTSGNHIQIHFNGGLYMESCCDYLQIRDGPNLNSPILAQYTGSMPNPPSVRSTGREVWILFRSDGSVVDRGFSATFYSDHGPSTEPYPESTVEPISTIPPETTAVTNPEPTRPTPPTPSCNEDLEQDSGTIQSPNYPFNYPDNSDCIWRINVTAGLKIGMQFGFDMRFESMYDYLEVRDGPNSDSALLETYTGAIQFPTPIMSSGSSLWVWFHSDDGKNEKGFTANFAGGRDKSEIEDLLRAHA